jgi:uncharacterized protein YjbI with pentapeptide repeats
VLSLVVIDGACRALLTDLSEHLRVVACRTGDGSWPTFIRSQIVNAATKTATIANVPSSRPVNRELVNTDLVNTELANTELVNTDLVNTDLVNTDLVNTDLVNTELANADLVNNKLVNTDLVNADLVNADLVNAVRWIGRRPKPDCLARGYTLWPVKGLMMRSMNTSSQ